MSRWWIGAALVALGCAASCNKPASTPEPEPVNTTDDRSAAKPAPKDNNAMATPTPKSSTSTTNGVVLTWKMTRDKPDKLVVEYEVENKSDHRVYACDNYLVAPEKPDQWRTFPGIRVEPVRDPANTAKLTIGTAATDLPGRPRPHFAALDPGAKMSGTRELKYPLEGRVPNGSVAPLPSGTNQAILTVFAIDGEPPAFKTFSGDGVTFKVPDRFEIMKLTAGPLAIP